MMSRRPGCLYLSLCVVGIGCTASAGYVPVDRQPALAQVSCESFKRADQQGLVTGLLDIVHGAGTPAIKAAKLQALLPRARSFADFHAALCFVAAVNGGLITQGEYYDLLDTIAPRAALGRLRPEVTAPATAPELVSPADSTVFDTYPRSTAVKWNPVEHAQRYLFEVEILLPDHGYRPEYFATGRVVSSTENTFDFGGAQWGRWRVRALGAQGQAGPPAAWRYFRYVR